MGTVIVGALLCGTVFLIIRSIVRDKKNGTSGCGGDCTRCKGCH